MFSSKNIAMTVIVIGLCSVAVQAQSTNTTLSTIAKQEIVLAVVPWSAGSQDLLCIVTEGEVTVDHETAPARNLTIYRQKGTALSKLFEFRTLDNFVNAYPLKDDDGRLFMTWSGGSAYHFRAYAFDGNKVRQVLDTGSKGMPEFLLRKDGNEQILITHDDSTTDIYQWNGSKYDVVSTVPWQTRLTAAKN